jgi:hypothetical protein
MKEMGLHFPGYKMKGIKMADSQEAYTVMKREMNTVEENIG